jgi:ATP-dependent helicase hrpB
VTKNATKFDLDTIGAGLPVHAQLATIRDAGSVVVQAPPGTGKTTLIPPLISNEVSEIVGKVVVTAPRRVAVRAAASRLASLDGSVIGDRVGYTIRGDAQPGRLVEFVTPKVLIRRLLRDPELAGVGAIIIDEVHERQLDGDLLLGMVAELAVLRPELRVVAMSATADAERFAALLGVPVISTPAEMFPVAERYEPLPGRAGCGPEFVAGVARIAAENTNTYSTLVFLPGVRDITACCAELGRITDVPVFPLHGGQSPAEQDRALRHAGPRIIVATNVAESSVTVPGVRTVVDAGLARVPKRDALRGMNGLVTVSCSQSSAVQRAGRAGREGPGTVIRCYSRSDYAHFAPHTEPEIRSADLTEFALLLSCWGATPAEFPLLDQPPAAAFAQATAALAAIGAADPQVAARLAQLPVDPRLGKALLDFGPAAAPTVALLSLGETGNIALRRPDQREVRRLQRLAGPSKSRRVAPGEVIGHAFPHLVARRVADGEYLLAQGTRAVVPAEFGLMGEEWLAVADVRLERSGRARVAAAAPIAESVALDVIGISEETECVFEDDRVRATRVVTAGAIVLSRTPVRPDPGVARAAVAAVVRERGVGLFPMSGRAARLWDRLRFLARRVGDPWPDVAAPAGGRGGWPGRGGSRLDELAPAELVVPSGRGVLVDYGGDRPRVQVKLQECFGLADSPVFGGERVVFELLSPAGRPVAITDDLASFWAGPYQNVRSEMRGKYPKHPWPVDPLTAVATARTKRGEQNHNKST